MTTELDEPGPGQVRHPWLAMLAWVPPLLALAWCIWFRVGVPEPAEWVFVRNEAPNPLRWSQCLDVEHGSAFLVYRCLYATLLSLPGIGFEFGNLLPWFAAFVTWLVSRRLLRKLVDPQAGAGLLWAVDLLLACWMFHPAWGLNWLLAGRVREFLPLAAFGMALLTLHGRGSWNLRWCGALFFVAIAEASHVTGLLVWMAIGPAVLGAARAQGVSRPLLSMFCFAGWAALVQVVVWQGLRVSAPPPGLVAFLSAQPGDLAMYLGRVTGLALPSLLPDFELAQGAVYGLVGCLLIVGTLAGRKPLDARTGTFLTLTLFGALVLVVVTEATYAWRPDLGNQPDAFVREGTVGALAFLLGGYGLLRECAPRVTGALRSLLLGAVLLIMVRDWHTSFEHLKETRCMLRTQAAELLLEEVTPGGGVLRVPANYTNLRTVLLALDDLHDLRKRGLFGHLPKLPGTDLAQGYPPPTGEPCGEFQGLQGSRLEGFLYGTTRYPAPGLVLVVRQRGTESRVIGVMRPVFSVDLRRVPLVGASPSRDLLKEGDILRAVGLEPQPLALRPLRGEFEVRATGLVLVEEAGK